MPMSYVALLQSAEYCLNIDRLSNGRLCREFEDLQCHVKSSFLLERYIPSAIREGIQELNMKGLRCLDGMVSCLLISHGLVSS